MPDPIFLIDITPEGIVATHPRRTELPVLVAPVPEEQLKKNYNTIRPMLVVVGCMQLPKGGFEFDSSFVGPMAERPFTRFARLMQALRQQDRAEAKRFPPCSIFGHADPTGRDGYNKRLAGRRAMAVYAVLTRDVKIWDKLFQNPTGGDRWGYRAIQLMMTIPLRKGEPQWYWGPVDGKNSNLFKAALNEYQKSRGLARSPYANTQTRHTLFREYMDAICHDPGGERFVLDPKQDFLARARSKHLRGDVQGCGEFNPVFLLSQQEEKELAGDKEQEEVRNQLYSEDRRVLIYAFQQGSEINPAVEQAWPCPAWDDDSVSKCKARFWSDGELRRKPGEERRSFKETRDTMACRFYHAFAEHSPCEAGLRLWRVRFRLDGFTKSTGNGSVSTTEYLKNRRYVLKAGETEFAPVMRGRTDEMGEIRIPVFDKNARLTLKLDVWGALFGFDQASGEGEASRPPFKNDRPSDGIDPDSGFDTDRFENEESFMTVELDAGALQDIGPGDDGPKQRLYNLGYGDGAPLTWSNTEFRNAVRQYRRRNGLGTGEDLDAATRDAIQKEHELTFIAPLEET